MKCLNTLLTNRVAAIVLLATTGTFGQARGAELQPPPARDVLNFHAAPHVRAFAENDTARVMAVVTADIDKENGPDVVTVQTDGMLNALHNKGSGKLENDYSNNSAVNSGRNVAFIEAADVDVDGYPDVVAADTKNNEFLVFLNKRDGTFADASIVPVGSPGGATLAGGGLAVGDVNADDKPDVVTVASAEASGSTIFSLQTFIGRGDGTFEPSPGIDSTLPGSFRLPPGRSLSFTDMNRDDKPDLVLQLVQSRPTAAIVISVSLGAGDGTFQNIPATGPTVSAGPQPASSLVAPGATVWIGFKPTFIPSDSPMCFRRSCI